MLFWNHEVAFAKETGQKDEASLGETMVFR